MLSQGVSEQPLTARLLLFFYQLYRRKHRCSLTVFKNIRPHMKHARQQIHRQDF